MAEMKNTALVPWFGTNRMTASNVGDKLRGLDWIGIVFAGGMSELAHVSCRSIVVNDKHRHVMNLAEYISIPNRCEELALNLQAKAFHPDTLRMAQQYCTCVEGGHNVASAAKWAEQYFVCCWMGRSAKAGTKGEFTGGLSTRWTSSGGDSNTRYRSAVESLKEWQKIMQRCNFSTLDFREFLSKCKDQPKHGIYADPPFPGAGDEYKHTFTEEDHITLMCRLSEFKQARVVVRYYDTPLIRDLYREHLWKWHEFDGRKQSNETGPEVLITNKV